MRLIDANELFKFIEDKTSCGRLSCSECEKVEPQLYNVCNHITNMPTAFDVGEVVKHLQAEHLKWTKGVKECQSMGWYDLERNLSGRAFATSKAIKAIEIEEMKQRMNDWRKVE